MATKETRHRKHAAINRFKASRGCERCGENDADVLTLHHANPSEKDPRLRDGRTLRSFSWVDLLAELRKCVVVCANCHIKIEQGLRGGVRQAS